MRGNGASFLGEGGCRGFFSSYDRKLGVPLELQRGSQGTFLVAKRESSLHSGCRRLLGIALELLWGKRALSRIEG